MELVVTGVAVFRLVLLGEPGIEGSRLDLRNRRWVGEVRLAARRILGHLARAGHLGPTAGPDEGPGALGGGDRRVFESRVALALTLISAAASGSGSGSGSGTGTWVGTRGEG